MLSDDNDFVNLLEWSWIKSVMLVLHPVVTMIGLLLLGFIVWYETTSSELHYRTLLNQLLSQVCLISCFAGLVYAVSFIWIVCLDIRSIAICNLLAFFGRLNFFLFLSGILFRQSIKFMYIFKYSCINCIDEDFAARLILTWNIMTGIILGIVSYFLGSHSSEVFFHVCNKMIPSNQTSCNDIRAQAFPMECAKADPLRIVVASVAIVLAYTNLHSSIYSNWDTLKLVLSALKIFAHGDGSSQSNNFRFFDKKDLISGTRQIFAIILLGFVWYAPTAIINRMNLADLNSDKGTIWFYLSQLSTRIFQLIVFPSVVIFSNQKIAAAFKKSILDRFPLKLRLRLSDSN